MFLAFLSVSSAPSAVQKKSPYINVTNREDAKDTKEEKSQFNQVGVCCNSGRSSATIAPSTGHTCKQMPQSMQVSKSIQNQSVPLTFLPGPG